MINRIELLWCSACKNRGLFKVETPYVYVGYDNETQAFFTDINYNLNTQVTCMTCGREDELKNFLRSSKKHK